MSSVLKQCVIPTKALSLAALLGPKGRELFRQELRDLGSRPQELPQLAWKQAGAVGSTWVLELGSGALPENLAGFAQSATIRVTERTGVLSVQSSMQHDSRLEPTRAQVQALERAANRCVNTVLALAASRLVESCLRRDLEQRLPVTARQSAQAVQAAAERALIRRPVMVGQRVVIQNQAYYSQYR